MSISSAVRKAGPYTGNGSTTAFPFAFKVFAASDLLVVRTDPSAIESTLTLGTDYSATLNASQDANPGGVVTTLAPPATGYLVTITSAVQNLQPVGLTNQGGFYPKVINDALDRATIQIQQVAEQVSRAVKVGISSSTPPDQLIAALNANVRNAENSAAAASDSASAASGSATNASNSAAAAASSAARIEFPIPVESGGTGGGTAESARAALGLGVGTDVQAHSAVLDGISSAPGRRLLQTVTYKTGAAASGPTVIPFDDTLPQSGEGDQFLSVSITPTAVGSTLEVTVNATVAHSNAYTVIGALFQDSDASASAVACTTMAIANGPMPIVIKHEVQSVAMVSTTFKFRAGAGLAGTTALNGIGGARRLGGALYSSITVKEYLP